MRESCLKTARSIHMQAELSRRQFRAFNHPAKYGRGYRCGQGTRETKCPYEQDHDHSFLHGLPPVHTAAHQSFLACETGYVGRIRKVTKAHHYFWTEATLPIVRIRSTRAWLGCQASPKRCSCRITRETGTDSIQREVPCVQRKLFSRVYLSGATP